MNKAVNSNYLLSVYFKTTGNCPCYGSMLNILLYAQSNSDVGVLFVFFKNPCSNTKVFFALEKYRILDTSLANLTRSS